LGIVVAVHYHGDIPRAELQKKYTYEESRFIEVEGMQVHYRTVGQGQPLVLIHGTNASLHTWEAWTDILSKDYEVISVDLPGYGLTGPHPKQDYSLDAYMEFLRKFLKAAGLDRVYMAGSSFGGNLTWNYALKYPKQISKMVLVDPSGYPFKEDDILLAFKLMNHPIMGKASEYVTPKWLVRQSLRKSFGDEKFVTEEMVNRYYELLLSEGNRKAAAQRIQNFSIGDNWKKLNTIKTPTLILWGDKDQLIKVENAKRFAEDMPNADLILYKDIGHLPMEEVAEESAQHTKDFLEKSMLGIEPPSAPPAESGEAEAPADIVEEPTEEAPTETE